MGLRIKQVNPNKTAVCGLGGSRTFHVVFNRVYRISRAKPKKRDKTGMKIGEGERVRNSEGVLGRAVGPGEGRGADGGADRCGTGGRTGVGRNRTGERMERGAGKGIRQACGRVEKRIECGEGAGVGESGGREVGAE